MQGVFVVHSLLMKILIDCDTLLVVATKEKFNPKDNDKI